jgi:hypothetical protein
MATKPSNPQPTAKPVKQIARSMSEMSKLMHARATPVTKESKPKGK